MKHSINRAPRSKVKFQDPMFTKFQDNFRTFLSVSQGSIHRKCTFFSVLVMLFIKADQYCSPKNVTKALL